MVCRLCGSIFQHRSSFCRHIHNRCKAKIRHTVVLDRDIDSDEDEFDLAEMVGNPANPLSGRNAAGSPQPDAVPLSPDVQRFRASADSACGEHVSLTRQELEFLRVHLTHGFSAKEGEDILGLLRSRTLDMQEDGVRFSTMQPLLKRLDDSDEHKVLCKDMKGDSDVDDGVWFWYIPVVQILQQLLLKPSLKGCWEWESQPQHTRDGERLYGGFNSGNWARDVCRVDDEAVLLSVIFGSDGTPTSGGFDSEAHPIYITSGNLSHKKRAADEGWEAAGIIPMTPDTKPGRNVVNKGRRTRILVTNCLAVLLSSINDRSTFNLQCSDGTIRKFELRLAAGIVDRLEAEDLVMSYQHQCFQCLINREQACDASQLAWVTNRSVDGQTVRDALHKAAFTGEYGSQSEWQSQYQAAQPSAQPILRCAPTTPLDGHQERIVWYLCGFCVFWAWQ